MTETDGMEELFERLPWLGEQFEIEQEIIQQLVIAESEYLKVLRKIEWAEHEGLPTLPSFISSNSSSQFSRKSGPK